MKKSEKTDDKSGSKQLSMRQRATFLDYTEPRILMITLTISGRSPMLGKLVCPDEWDKSDNWMVYEKRPYIELSHIGSIVERCWYDVINEYQQIEPMVTQIMPDHMHSIIRIKEKLPKHLGRIIGWFAYYSTRRVNEFIAEGPPRLTQPDVSMTQNDGKADSQIKGTGIQCSKRHLWEKGFHDRILYGKDQLKNMIRYVKENPLRLATKRHRSYYFQQMMIEIGGMVCNSIGNRNLLMHPNKIQVRCSRSLTDKEIEQEKNKHLELSRNGAVIVSPCISPGEQAIARNTRKNGYPLIVILENGFSEYYKPPGEYFQACANGNLLMLAPWKYHPEKRNITREQCLQLNAIAEKICNEKQS